MQQKHCGAGWGSWWDQAGVPEGQACRLERSGSSGFHSGKGQQQSPSLPHHSLCRQHSCHAETIHFIVSPHSECLAGEPRHPPATGPLLPCTALHLQLIRVQAELSLWQLKQEERRLGASQG